MGWTRATLLLGAGPVPAGQGEAAEPAKDATGAPAAEDANVEGFRSAGFGMTEAQGPAPRPTVHASTLLDPEHRDGFPVPKGSF